MGKLKVSPMMQDYLNTKEKYKDCILFYRLGDFYEMFFEDAILVSKELEITLTGKSCGLEEKAPMAGVPHHSAEGYIQRLIEKGYKVAICEQLENPKDIKGVVKRGVVKVVTPGTITESNMLDEKKNSYILSIFRGENGYGVSSLDVSTGKFYTTEIIIKENQKEQEVLSKVLDEVSRFNPKEILVNKEVLKNKRTIDYLKEILNIYITEKDNDYFEFADSEIMNLENRYVLYENILKNSFKDKKQKLFTYAFKTKKEVQNSIYDLEVEGFNNSKEVKEEKNNDKKENQDIKNKSDKSHELKDINKIVFDKNSLYIHSIYGLNKYIEETQMLELKHIKEIQKYSFEGYMALDSIARKNLEINYRMMDQSKKGSLLWVLDKTETSMGARMLSNWINAPLVSKEEINKRLDSVEELKENIILKGALRESLKKIYDIERISGKVAFGNINGKDMIALKNSIKYLPEIKEILKNVKSEYLLEIINSLDTMQDIYGLIDEMIEEEPPLTITEGRLIKETFNEELKRLRHLGDTGREWIANLEASEREKTDIKTLKIGYNKIFGYYIEVTNMNKDKVPETYIRKQTLANAERYVTPELKQMEEELLNAEDKANKIEYELFLKLRELITKELDRLKKASDLVAILDVLSTYAQVSEDNDYVKPTINTEGKLEIHNGRHPVVEKTIKDENFVDNNCYLDNENDTVMIITGPNMSGKSTYMRQVALITLMAQIGCFVPATCANISIVDKIFTRIGASDDLSMGQSTFMMEMSEVANILNNATKNSLVILDEIGRGTSTYDGMSIAKAVVEYISDTKNIGCKTLFATHYHELVELENEFKNIKNYHVDAKEIGKDILFLRKVIPGGTDDSYGIHVAKLAGIPQKVLNNANNILKNIEKQRDAITLKNLEEKENIEGEEEVGVVKLEYSKTVEKLKNIDINRLTPLEAFTIITEITNELNNK